MPAATAINTGKPIYPEAAVVAGPEDLVVEKTGSVETRFLRSHSFLIAWSEVSAGGATLEADSPTEYFAMLPGDGATLAWSGGERAVPSAADGDRVVLRPERAVDLGQPMWLARHGARCVVYHRVQPPGRGERDADSGGHLGGVRDIAPRPGCAVASGLDLVDHGETVV